MSEVRIHGFQWPLDPHQVSAWVGFGLFAVAFFTLYTPLHTNAGSVIATVIYANTVAATIVTAVCAMHSDPSDPGLVAADLTDLTLVTLLQLDIRSELAVNTIVKIYVRC